MMIGGLTMTKEILQDFRRQLRRTPEVRSSVPFEAKWSYPIPTIKGNQVLLRFLIYSLEVAPEKPKIKFYPPYKYVEAAIVTDPKVSVTRIRKPEELTEPLGETPPPGIRDLSYEQIDQLHEDFYSLIEKILPFIGKQQISQQDTEVVQKYRRYFDLLVEPEMQVEYRKISPEFFQWMDRVPPIQ